MFFVASAPLARDGRVNVSPKGPIGTFAALGPNRVAYLDFYGSGAETVAHIRENGRITSMFCEFAGPPRILRLHGTGEAVFACDERFEDLLARGRFDPYCRACRVPFGSPASVAQSQSMSGRRAQPTENAASVGWTLAPAASPRGDALDSSALTAAG